MIWLLGVLNTSLIYIQVNHKYFMSIYNMQDLVSNKYYKGNKKNL